MDVLQLLDNELKEKHWNLEHKKRYLYLRSCQLFTYDTRYHFIDKINSIELERNIEKNVIDLKNVIDNRVICFSWTLAYTEILQELLNVDAKFVTDMLGNHAWAFFGTTADATSNSDLTRVKMGLSTMGYELSTREDIFDYDILSCKKVKKMDKNLKYIKKDYCKLDEIAVIYQKEFLKQNVLEDDILSWWIDKILKIYDNFRDKVLFFEDASFCISYIIRHLLKVEKRITYKKVTLFQQNNDECDFIDIYKFESLGREVYYVLTKGDLGYDFYEISYNDFINYINSLKGKITEKENILSKSLRIK